MDPCQKRTELLLAYSSAVTTYSKLLMELHEQIGILPAVEYAYLTRYAEDSRVAADSAKVILEHHIAVHGC